MKKNNWNIEFILFVEKMLPTLKEYKGQDDHNSFNELFKKSLPKVKVHISRALKASIKNGSLSEGKYCLDDILNELFIQAYQHIEEVKEDDLFHSWIFKKANEILEDIIIDEDFDRFFFKNIDNYTGVEWDEMEENFLRDSDGDLIMEEELDDVSYPKHDYLLEDVFVENYEEKIIDKLNKELTEQRVHKHILFVLHYMPFRYRVVFELATNALFDTKEIAYIINKSMQQVEGDLKTVRTKLSQSFESRLLLDKQTI